MAIFRAFHIFRTCFDRSHHDIVRITGGSRVNHLTFAVEHEPNRASFPEVATILGEGRTHGRGGAVFIVGHGFHDDSHTIGAIPLIADFIIVFCVTTHGFLDRAFDHVLGHRLAFGFFHCQAQTWVFIRIRIPHLCGDSDLFGEF